MKVKVQDLKKRYGAIEAAKGVSFDIRDGEIFGLLGPNGAGKTTTVECTIGLREPDEGSIEICGIDARRRPREARQKVGAALQTTALQDKITAREALTLFGSFYQNRSEPQTLLEQFALTDKADAPFDSLSGGQRQRLALALAFVNKPELVFLDEPTAGLDPQSRRELHGEIARMKRDGHTVLLTTHYIDEAQALCDRIAIISDGRIVASGAPNELIGQSDRLPAVSIVTTQAMDADVWNGLKGIESLERHGTSARFRTSNVNVTVAELLARLEARGIAVSELHVQKATLEDVFLELTQTGLGTRDSGLEADEPKRAPSQGPRTPEL
jgi:ABC-2 type transport system ATP-binding protein